LILGVLIGRHNYAGGLHIVLRLLREDGQRCRKQKTERANSHPPPDRARVTVVLADSWQFTPFMILVLYAGLNTVDHSQIEAAQIDGAGVWTLLFRIMLPAIRPLIVFVLAIRLMDAFRFFDTIYVLTSGGPGTATETITLYTYALAFRLLQIGKASALGVLTLLFVAALVALMIRLVYRRERGAF